MIKKITIIWHTGKLEGSIIIRKCGGYLLEIEQEEGFINGSDFKFQSTGECRLNIEIIDASMESGAFATIVNVNTSMNPFSFLLRDVNASYPIYIAEYGVVVTEYDDNSSYKEIIAIIEQEGRLSRLEKIEKEQEESFENASKNTRELQCVTWLGLCTDVRIFEAGFRAITYRGPWRETWDWVRPKFHCEELKLQELEGKL